MAKSNKNTAGTLRIIGGNWRGRKLGFTAVDGLRPTSDRIRETVFNWLQMHVGSARCLDLFAGSGALGLEAASRGADHVDMVELDRTAIQSLQQNLTALNAQQCQLHHQSAQAFLQQQSKPYHVVFIDPPFKLNLWEEVIQLLSTKGLLADGARIYIEMPKRHILHNLPAGWELLREKQTGDVKYCLFEYIAGAINE